VLENDFNARSVIQTSAGDYRMYRLSALEEAGLTRLERLPFSIRILLEGVLRKYNQGAAKRQDVINLSGWQPRGERPVMPFFPGRVLMQDFTGVPVLVDLAALRSAVARFGGDPARVNPSIPVDIVIDHSVQVDYFGTPDAFQRNAEIEFQRNRERYELLHWGQKAFTNLRVVPPATGIVHQVNLEFLAPVVLTKEVNGEKVAYPDTLVGTDSHTTMINGLGVVGWGVGGIEAAAAMLDQPLEMLIPDVIGFKLTGALSQGVTPTDLTLTVTQMLRKLGVVNKFVEFFGPGLSSLTLADRAMIANMSPENGATITFFPVDEQTLAYLSMTGRSEKLVELVEKYLKEQQLFRSNDTPDPEYTDVLELALETVQPSLAGPKRPQDRIQLDRVQQVFKQTLTAPRAERGFALTEEKAAQTAKIGSNGHQTEIGHGAVTIAAITSCTNTSNPFVMIGAGLVAKKAVERGLQVPFFVKTSLAPGSRVVTDYLKHADLLEPLEKLGFSLVGYGCTTCIGNSGPLKQEVVDAINSADLVAAAVLSGNRNFEGRISPHVQANFLASPPMVVVYALAGTIDKDLTREPVGIGTDGKPVYLRDIWPTTEEVMETVRKHITPEMFKASYASVFTGNPTWNAIEGHDSELYPWDEDSTYIQEPPYFEDFSPAPQALANIYEGRVLAMVGDSVTTDHISPAGSIASTGAAGKYLLQHGVAIHEFNSYGSRRGNDRVMTRGTFGNIRLKNLLVPGVEGSYTVRLPEGEQMSIFDASVQYRSQNVPLIVIAGKEYGTGSSRDWAAKGPMLLGVKAVIAESFERIHRSNLAGMGILPLQFMPGENAASLGLTGRERYTIEGIAEGLEPGKLLEVRAVREDGTAVHFNVITRLDTDIDIVYYNNGGLLQTILYDMLASPERDAAPQAN
jgi:aconitate hydratase